MAGFKTPKCAVLSCSKFCNYSVEYAFMITLVWKA